MVGMYLPIPINPILAPRAGVGNLVTSLYMGFFWFGEI